MHYNFEKIGKRLKSERKDAGIKSQDDLSEKLEDYVGPYSRFIISRWENGKELPPMDVLCALCEIYDCDMGYLLCEYDCKTRPKTDIAAETGLSEQAIDVISNLDNNSIAALNELITSLTFPQLLLDIGVFIAETDRKRTFPTKNVDPLKHPTLDDIDTKIDVERYNISVDIANSLKDIQNNKNREETVSLFRSDLFKRRSRDKIWWVDDLEQPGGHLFSFDKKKFYNLQEDYPDKLTPEEKKIFDHENPDLIKKGN